MSLIGDKHRKYLIDTVLSEEITIPIPVDGEEFVKWMEENIGEERPHHPYDEAEDGYMDYFEGEWASRIIKDLGEKRFKVWISRWCEQRNDKVLLLKMVWG